MFDFNDSSVLDNAGSSIFNGGNSGKVNNVTITMERKPSGEMSNKPDVNFFFADTVGTTKMGWYFGKKNSQFDDKTNEKMSQNNVIKLFAIAKAIVPADYVFPSSEGMSFTDAEKMLLTVIEQNIADKKVNVFVCYGTKNKASAYLNVRQFAFIESVNTPEDKSKLVQTNTDNMIRIEPTAPSATPTSGVDEVDGW